MSKKDMQQADLEQLVKMQPLDDDFMRELFRNNLPLAEFVLGVSAMCKLMENRVNEAKAATKIEKSIEIAENFLKMGNFSLEDIAKGTGLPIEEVEKLAKQIKK